MKKSALNQDWKNVLSPKQLSGRVILSLLVVSLGVLLATNFGPAIFGSSEESSEDAALHSGPLRIAIHQDGLVITASTSGASSVNWKFRLLDVGTQCDRAIFAVAPNHPAVHHSNRLIIADSAASQNFYRNRFVCFEAIAIDTSGRRGYAIWRIDLGNPIIVETPDDNVYLQAKHPTTEEFLADLGISFNKNAVGLTRDDVIAFYEPYLTNRGNKVLNRVQFYESPGIEELHKQGIYCSPCYSNGTPYALYSAPQPRPAGWTSEWPIGGRHRRAENELGKVMHEVSHGFDDDNDNGGPDKNTYFSWLNGDDVEGVGSLRQAFRKFSADPPTSKEFTGFRHPRKEGVCMYVDYNKMFFHISGGYLAAQVDNIRGTNTIIDGNIYHVNPELGNLLYTPVIEFAADLPLHIKPLPTELEKHYSLFFKDRQKIVQITWALDMHNYSSDNRTTQQPFVERFCP